MPERPNFRFRVSTGPDVHGSVVWFISLLHSLLAVIGLNLVLWDGMSASSLRVSLRLPDLLYSLCTAYVTAFLVYANLYDRRFLVLY